jgi:general secretion pathway protein B
VSILLEALRKSEKNQHSPEAPSIHTDDQQDPATDSIKTGPLALLVVVALFASGWFVWQQYQPPAGSYQPPVTLKADQTRAVTTPAENSEAAGGKTIQAVPSGTVANNSSVRPRTPVESYQATTSNNSQPKPTTPKPATPKPAKNDPVKQLVDDSDKQPATRKAPPLGSVGVVKEEPPSRELEPISYWELPDAIRADIPEIKFSVLVYAKNPADRFVLINGQRLVEGDSPQSGLIVKEIRRDGVVFSYRLYQFLVER